MRVSDETKEQLTRIKAELILEKGENQSYDDAVKALIQAQKSVEEAVVVTSGDE